MGRNFVITNSNTVELGAKKKTIKKEFVIGPTAIKFVTMAIVAVLCIVYLSQSTAGATRSLKVRNIDDQKTKLLLERERLEAEQTRLKALREIDGGVEKQVLEPVSKVDHLSSDRSLARSN